MCIKVSLGSKPGGGFGIAPVFQLAPMQLLHADERGVTYRPSAKDFTARIILSLLILPFGVGVYVLAWMGEHSDVEGGIDQGVILILKLIAAAIVLFPAAWLMSWPWARFRVTSDNAGNLVVKRHGWFKRNWRYPFSELDQIAYGMKQAPVYSVNVHSTGRSRLIAAPWIWYIRLDFKPTFEGGEPWPVTFNLYAYDQTPQSNERPPDDVVALGRWLQQKTGMKPRLQPSQPIEGAPTKV